MTVSITTLTKGLQEAASVDEFIVTERRGRVVVGGTGGLRERTPHDLEATLYVDRSRGRGSALLTPSLDLDQPSQIRDAATRAAGALGPSWRLPAPAAPAQVSVHDAQATRDPHETVRQVLDQLTRVLPNSATATGSQVRVERSARRTILSNSFDNEYESSAIHLTTHIIAQGGEPVPVALATRRLRDFDFTIADAVERAHEASKKLANAKDFASGMVDLAIVARSYLPRNATDYGIWTPIVRQANAGLLRAGMSLLIPGRPLVSNTPRGDLLSIASEGTEPFGIRSAPFSRDGQAVRNFALISENAVTGVAVDHQESALGAGPANGGVRRLIVGSGSRSASELLRPGARPLLVAEAIDSVQMAGSRTVHLEITRGEQRTRNALGHVRSQTVKSIQVCGDLFSWLEHAYFSEEQEDEDWHMGPRIVRFENVRAL